MHLKCQVLWWLRVCLWEIIPVLCIFVSGGSKYRRFNVWIRWHNQVLGWEIWCVPSYLPWFPSYTDLIFPPSIIIRIRYNCCWFHIKYNSKLWIWSLERIRRSSLISYLRVNLLFCSLLNISFSDLQEMEVFHSLYLLGYLRLESGSTIYKLYHMYQFSKKKLLSTCCRHWLLA